MTAADVARHVAKLLQDGVDVGYQVMSSGREFIVTTDKLTVIVRVVES
jgi:hypothetical protein